MNDKTGGPAFPYQIDLPNGNGSETTHYSMGMSMRDYFAAKVMQGLITSRHKDFEDGWYDEETVAANAYKMADAMLRERDK